MKDKIIKVLKAHPKGLKAKEIASYIPNTDRRMINQVLYTNKDCFQRSADYVWTLKIHTLTDKEKKFAESLVAQIIAEIKKTAPKTQKQQITPSKKTTNTSTKKTKDVIAPPKNNDYSIDYRRIRLEEELRRKRAEEERHRSAEIEKMRAERQKEKELIESLHGNIYSSKILRKCTDDCATCNREYCIEEQ